ncbi:MAG: Rne/Rng family ribonuclease [Terracidiphilus sp.]
MAKEICISSTPHETRLAILEDDQLAEIYYERENEYTLAGSIYNGRVTRVLPGMQSAFVDIGLERDAFLYVTDFLELEDQEETDELEKATVSSPNQPPREVRHDRARNGQRQDHPERESRPAPEGDRGTSETAFIAPESKAAGEPGDAPHEETGDPGAKRWRGRRRRRGGRGGPGAPEGQAETTEQAQAAPIAVPERTQGARDFSSATESSPRAERTPTPFVLPGEALSKYGAVPAESEKKSFAESEGSSRPAITSRPSTLVDKPIEWDGSGLLPGESLSRHRTRQADPSPEVHAEPQGSFSDATATHETTTHEILFEESSSHLPETASAAHPLDLHAGEGLQPDEEFIEETLVDEHVLPAETTVPDETPGAYGVVHSEPTTLRETAHAAGIHESDAEDLAFSETTETSDEPDADASASHRVDPTPPSGFRLFGFGGKGKKEEDEHSAPAPVAHRVEESAPAAPIARSTFSPGNGLVEEEMIEGEEIDAPAHRQTHRHDEHDLDEYEEETLQTQIRSGELGEMLQEAHLDHKIQLNFDDKAVADEEEDEGLESEDEEEPVAAEGHPPSEGQAQPRRDRGNRGRRGRGDRGAGPRPGDRRGGPSRRSAQATDLPIISDLLKPGQEILVQIAKEPIAKKGARITSHIALPGRFLVFMPTVTHVGVSRKIASDEERQRLKRILTHERGEASGGFIVRTAAEGASEEELRADLRFLIHLWNEIKQRSDNSKSPALIYHDLSLIERILRDQVSANFSSIWVDSEADYERIVRFLNRFSPSLVRRVKLYTKETPLFEHFGIQDEISKALRSKVWLKSGGSIVINQTEALVAIDINTGKYVGKTARLEDTIVKTNLDAIPEIVRQIRLRDLGGIIIIDFIDMDERKNRFKVMAALEEALKNDRAPTKVLQFNDFGLVAITRKRVKQSLERTLSVPCPVCQATGMVKSPATVCNEIFTELRKMRKHFENGDVLLRVHPETVKSLKSNNARWLTDFEELTGKNILVKSDATLHPEQFDIQG